MLFLDVSQYACHLILLTMKLYVILVVVQVVLQAN